MSDVCRVTKVARKAEAASALTGRCFEARIAWPALLALSRRAHRMQQAACDAHVALAEGSRLKSDPSRRRRGLGAQRAGKAQRQNGPMQSLYGDWRWRPFLCHTAAQLQAAPLHAGKRGSGAEEVLKVR